MTIHIPVGTEIRDEDGKLIATAARDIFSGEIPVPDQFIWPDAVPVIGEKMHPAFYRFLK